MRPHASLRKNGRYRRPPDQQAEQENLRTVAPRVRSLHRKAQLKKYQPTRRDKTLCGCRAHDRFQAESMRLRLSAHADLLKPNHFFSESIRLVPPVFFAAGFQACHSPPSLLQSLQQREALFLRELQRRSDLFPVIFPRKTSALPVGLRLSSPCRSYHVSAPSSHAFLQSQSDWNFSLPPNPCRTFVLF